MIRRVMACNAAGSRIRLELETTGESTPMCTSTPGTVTEEISVSELTKRERVMRTVRFQETDRVPLYDILQNDAVIECYAGERLTVEDGDRVKGLAIGRTLDMTRMPGGPNAPGIVRQENGLVVQRERWTDWIIERPWSDPEGHGDFVAASPAAWIKEEIRRAESQVFGREYAELTHGTIHRFQAYSTAGGVAGRDDPVVLVVESGVGLTEMYWMLGLESFSYLMADDPSLVEEWLEARHQAELRRVAAIADPKIIPIALTYDDIAYKHSLIFSPAWLRKHWVPRLKKLVAAWNQRDVVCLFHSDGNLWPILDDLVSAGIDGLNPLEVLASMTVEAVRRRYPNLILTGGIDVSQLLSLGTPEEVRCTCRQAIADTGGRGYFLGSTTELHWGVRLENAAAMFETAWEMAK